MVPKKIMLIIPEMSMGGAQRSLSKLSVELARTHQVWLIIFNRNHSIAYPFAGELLSLDVVSGPGIFQKIKALALRILRLRKMKKKLGIQISISFLEGADYINVLSKVSDKIVLSVRGSKKYDENIKKIFFRVRNRTLIPWLYSKADAIVTVNHGIARELQLDYGLTNVPFATIGNFYDKSEIERLSLEAKEPDLERLYKRKVLITTGRLAPEKGLVPLITVFSRVKRNIPNLHLVMVGEGQDFQHITKKCRQLNLTFSTSSRFGDLPDIVLLGNQSNVFKYLKGATCYLMNSSSEGFPNGIAEAMICGVPVISSDCPYGPREIMVSDLPFSENLPKPFISENGILMPVICSEEDIAVWSETLSEILMNTNLLTNLAANAIERIALFDKNSILLQWQRIIADDQIINDNQN